MGMGDVRGLLVVVLQVFGLFYACMGQTGDYCQTPRNSQGECKLITKCQVLFSLLQNRPIKAQDADYLRRSQCGFEGTMPKVCCPLDTDGNQAAPEPSVSNFDNVKPVTSNLLPSNDVCGLGTQDRIYGGEEAGLTEFPWMALVEYERENGRRGFYCGGVLINNKYVLTAAHCVKGKDLPRSWKLVSVRLGEYNTETDVDCVNDGFSTTCAPPPLNIPVEERIAHEDYVPEDINQYHDIALLRLGREVKFTGFVQPVCLPKSSFDQKKNFVGKKLTVSGWGKTENKSESAVKLKLNVPVKSNDDCAKTYKSANVALSRGQLCAGGEKGKDSCRGDSGGPLMTQYADENGEIAWYSIGVVSFGPSPCGMELWPGVYTKVANYVPWIVSKLRPRNSLGECKLITKCPVVLDVLQKRPINVQNSDYLKKSRCGLEGTTPKVCCPLDTDATRAATETRVSNMNNEHPVNSELLPSKDICGLVGDESNKIHGGEKAELFEFPWMALVEYERGNGSRGFYCGGVLINRRYVMTAAHCLKGKFIPRSWKVVSVRLGEHDRNNATDCSNLGYRTVCAPPPLNIPIEERIAHEDYDPEDANQYHDIALLRLARDVKFTGSVQPVCLPTTKLEQEKNLIGEKLTVAGWGQTENKSESAVKLKLDVPVKDNEVCNRAYRIVDIALKPGQICAGGEKGKDSCKGDSGGPLMTQYADEYGGISWYSIGVVSFGPSPCGRELWPGVYTKVADYVPWIVSKLKP
ncbi:hypothetical protein NQ315_009776 [Exocentrus adspersus]|uniref:CLIP domain-containing serine protease n=1 Tax=Exocentrus adspersus TaxID=1586481 RepID=A0AAV8WHG5_9CUCU|nr:hypothetical protein NQ315_009776 [Exocentrus adspersus]